MIVGFLFLKKNWGERGAIIKSYCTTEKLKRIHDSFHKNEASYLIIPDLIKDIKTYRRVHFNFLVLEI